MIVIAVMIAGSIRITTASVNRTDPQYHYLTLPAIALEIFIGLLLYRQRQACLKDYEKIVQYHSHIPFDSSAFSAACAYSVHYELKLAFDERRDITSMSKALAFLKRRGVREDKILKLIEEYFYPTKYDFEGLDRDKNQYQQSV